MDQELKLICILRKLIHIIITCKNSEIVQIQMDYCRKELDLAMIKGRQSIEIIHGIGEGILMNEVHKLLDLYNLRYYVSNDSGSTEVIL